MFEVPSSLSTTYQKSLKSYWVIPSLLILMIQIDTTYKQSNWPYYRIWLRTNGFADFWRNTWQIFSFGRLDHDAREYVCILVAADIQPRISNISQGTGHYSPLSFRLLLFFFFFFFFLEFWSRKLFSFYWCLRFFKIIEIS